MSDTKPTDAKAWHAVVGPDGATITPYIPGPITLTLEDLERLAVAVSLEQLAASAREAADDHPLGRVLAKSFGLPMPGDDPPAPAHEVGTTERAG